MTDRCTAQYSWEADDEVSKDGGCFPSPDASTATDQAAVVREYPILSRPRYCHRAILRSKASFEPPPLTSEGAGLVPIVEGVGQALAERGDLKKVTSGGRMVNKMYKPASSQ